MPLDLYTNAELLTICMEREPVQLCVSRVPHTGVAACRGRLLLLHGNPASMYDFGRLAEQLRDHYELAAVDLPGFGRSANLPGLLGRESVLDAYARHVEAVTRGLGWHGAFHLLGHSHGGAVAQALSALFPERVLQLVLLASVGTPACWAYRQLAMPGVLKTLRWLASALRYPSPREVRRQIVRTVMTPIFAPFPLPDPWVDEQLANVDRRPEILVNMAVVATGDPCGQLAGMATRIRASTLFIHGDSDNVVSAPYTRALHQIIARNALVAYHELAYAGHMLHLSHPELICALLLAFSSDMHA